MSNYTLEEFIYRAQDFGLLSLDDIQSIWRNLSHTDVSPKEFFNMAVQQGILTKYQSERLVAGDAIGYFYGDYKVLSFIANGAIARTYRAIHTQTDTTVALRVLRTRFLKDADVSVYFKREAETGARLNYFNISTAHGLIETPTDRFIVYDFIEGRTLAKILKTVKNITVLDSVKIIRDICSALDYAAQRNRTHRDIKLGNIIVSPAGRAFMIGFGRDLLTLEQEAKLRSPTSIDYSSLEKLSGVSRGDKRSDLFFLGSVFYHILTGQPALFETEDISRRSIRHRFINFRPAKDLNPEIPNFLIPILDRALCFEPEKRYQTPNAMLKDLETALFKLDPTSTRISTKPAAVSSAAANTNLNGKTILIVEGNQDMQEFYKEIFKQRGYRLIIISDPERAVERYEYGDSPSVDCIFINAQTLGIQAVEAFNNFAIVQNSRYIPAILMLGEKQDGFVKDTIRCGTRGIVQLPITVRSLFGIIEKLLKSTVNRDKINRRVHEYESQMFSVAAQQKNDFDEDDTKPFPLPEPPLSSKRPANKAAEEAFAAALEDLMMFTD